MIAHAWPGLLEGYTTFSRRGEACYGAKRKKKTLGLLFYDYPQSRTKAFCVFVDLQNEIASDPG